MGHFLGYVGFLSLAINFSSLFFDSMVLCLISLVVIPLTKGISVARQTHDSPLQLEFLYLIPSPKNIKRSFCSIKISGGNYIYHEVSRDGGWLLGVR